ncbi:hypothetical protein [Candidatus Nanohalovita haloferacivicina]|uniref:hypothetical protein n=1 Tax=Candidatus Nanohalovita haloferacivicina TaxID=2978046 RepID=UPI00325FA4D5|nr:hypothetical protein HBNXNv_0781 [Candidatus Nanohalobia archaeon BNXNv]
MQLNYFSARNLRRPPNDQQHGGKKNYKSGLQQQVNVDYTKLGILLTPVALIAAVVILTTGPAIEFGEDTAYTEALQNQMIEEYRQNGPKGEMRVIVELYPNSTAEEYNSTRERFSEKGLITAEFPTQRSFGLEIQINELLQTDKSLVEEIRIDQLNGIRQPRS